MDKCISSFGGSYGIKRSNIHAHTHNLKKGSIIMTNKKPGIKRMKGEPAKSYELRLTYMTSHQKKEAYLQLLKNIIMSPKFTKIIINSYLKQRSYLQDGYGDNVLN
jgi:hypothetical protein